MVALDGKVLKGAWEELPDVKVKLFSALVHGEGVIIGQRKVPGDTTEVTQVLPLIDDIAAVHGITSLTAWQANPADLLAGNRGHWEVENREHYVRDRTFDEDRSQVRTGSSPQFLATARNIAISLLRLVGCLNIAHGLEYLSRRLDQILALLGLLPAKISKKVIPTARLCL